MAKKATPAKSKKTPIKVKPEPRFVHYGRPTIYTEELAVKICKLLAEGKTLLKICKDEGMPNRKTIHEWVLTNPVFSNSYRKAREMQAEHYADEILDIADNGSNDYVQDEETGKVIVNYDHIKRSQLRVQARQWYAAKVAPKKYGDKVEMSGPDGQPVSQVQIYIPDNGRK